ncbi:MAG TPA: hypothetical protein DCF33_22575, partial [Saprospirales bacterium]|nr:hypothetical protein [Saprospirales bacterium]
HPDSRMVLAETVPGQNGYVHYKYQQIHLGVPIFGNTYILHEQNGQVVRASGRYSPQVKTSVKPGMDQQTAMVIAKRAMKAHKYNDKLSSVKLMLIDPAFPKVSEDLALVYQVNLVATEPANKHQYFIEATGGKIICDFPLILQHGVPSTAQTKYYGVQQIITDSIGPQAFILRDPTRGEGIFIFHDNGDLFTNTDSHWDLTNANMDEVALDAHYCTQEYYDVMLESFGWKGQDGLGKALKVRVHAGGPGLVNAYWDGEFSSFGDGDCNYGPLTTLEVVGHEFTHGMIDYTSRLVYSGESGAINESLADIFGKLLEYKSAPDDHNWSLGESFIINPESEPFRRMNDPNSLEMPAMYNGLFWEAGNGVHTNSAIGNLWFSMLVDGKQGMNEAGTAYQITGLGFDKATQIVFQTNKAYLTESSDYNSFYQYSVAAAEEIYGQGSSEVQDVKEAWKAVGLPASTFGALDLTVVGEQNWNTSICGLGGYLPIKVKVVNRSGEAYDPATGGSVLLSGSPSNPNFTYPLTVPIAPGETYTFEVNNWYEKDVPAFVFIDITLQVNDEDPSNNFAYGIYNIVEHESDDLSIYTYTLEPECFADSLQMTFIVTNNSCEPVSAGTVLTFNITDEQSNLIWSETYSLPGDLAGGSNTSVYWHIPLLSGSLTYELIHEGDPDLLNNQYTELFNSFYQPITGNYFNNFEENNGEDNYLDLGYGGGTGDIFQYQNSHFFGSTGAFQDEIYINRCPEPLSVFEQINHIGITASIRACVDMTGNSNPGLSFDLAMFRNETAQAEGFLFSSMLQARWDGNQSGKEVFYGQPEGSIESKNIPLPAQFKGAVTLIFYTELGDWQLNANSIANDDVVLLDNLRLSTTVGTLQPALPEQILVYPNPAQDLIRIEAKEAIKHIQIQDVNGRILRGHQVQGDFFNLSLTEIPEGIYFLAIHLESGVRATTKVVKI